VSRKTFLLKRGGSTKARKPGSKRDSTQTYSGKPIQQEGIDGPPFWGKSESHTSLLVHIRLSQTQDPGTRLP